MTNAELISMVRSIAKHGADWRINEVLNRAADALEAADKRIAELEAQLPKEGEWIWDADTGIYRCSECGGASPREDQDGEYIDCPNYCQNCGAKMKGENDEQIH